MLKIKSQVDYIPRVKLAPPEDGVHRAGKDGSIKGCHSLMFGDRLVPKGQTAFYWRVGENEGLRVSFSFGWFKAIKGKIVQREYEILKKMYKLGISPRPKGMEDVALDLNYTQKSKRIKCFAHAIRVQHVHYPENAWKEYAEGKPYDWGCVEHKDHNPEGFLKFVKDAKPKAKEIDTSWKLGDVLWCNRNKRWYLVDSGR